MEETVKKDVPPIRQIVKDFLEKGVPLSQHELYGISIHVVPEMNPGEVLIFSTTNDERGQPKLLDAIKIKNIATEDVKDADSTADG